MRSIMKEAMGPVMNWAGWLQGAGLAVQGI